MIKKQMDFLRQNFIFYLVGVLVIIGIKLYYRQAGCDSLLWILAPTVRWVECLSGISFVYLPGTGYVNHDMRLLVAPSCSGVRFLTITFAALVFSFVHRIAWPRGFAAPVSRQSSCGNFAAPVPGRSACGNFAEGGAPKGKAVMAGLGWIAVSAVLSWLFTVFVNGLRIIAAIYLPLYFEQAGLMKGMLTQDRLHTMIGVVVYFMALLVIYRLAEWFVQRVAGSAVSGREKPTAADFLRRCTSPVCWYFVLTLGLPLLNRLKSGSEAEFTEFAALVTGCCGIVLLTYLAMVFCRRALAYFVKFFC